MALQAFDLETEERRKQWVGRSATITTVRGRPLPDNQRIVPYPSFDRPTGELVALDTDSDPVPLQVNPNCVVLDVSHSDVDPYEYADVEKLFQFKNPEQLNVFLASNQDVLAFLPKIHGQLRKIFDEDAPLFLKVLEDREDAEDAELLVLVAVEEEPEAALKKLGQFHGWWMDNGDDYYDRVIVDIRYQ